MKNILDKVSYHAVYDASILDALGFASENGFAGVQVAVESPHLSFAHMTDNDCREISEFCLKQRLSVSLHCPDHVTSLFTFSPQLIEGIFRYYEDLFVFAENIGSRLITIHIGEASSFGTDTVPRTKIPDQDVPVYAQMVEQNLQRLVDLAASRFVLCVENYQMDPILFDILQPYLEAGKLSLCWDLVKTYDRQMRINQPVVGYFRRNIEFVRQVHLHDIRDGRGHRVIGAGNLEFGRFLPDLAKADVLDFCIEVRPREKALESLVNLRCIVEAMEK